MQSQSLQEALDFDWGTAGFGCTKALVEALGYFEWALSVHE